MPYPIQGNFRFNHIFSIETKIATKCWVLHHFTTQPISIFLSRCMTCFVGWKLSSMFCCFSSSFLTKTCSYEGKLLAKRPSHCPSKMSRTTRRRQPLARPKNEFFNPQIKFETKISNPPETTCSWPIYDIPFCQAMIERQPMLRSVADDQPRHGHCMMHSRIQGLNGGRSSIDSPGRSVPKCWGTKTR